MKFSRLKSVIFIGFLAIVGVIIMQLLLLNNVYKFEKKELENKIFFALKNVVERVYSGNKTNLTYTNQVDKVTDDYYLVNIDDALENNILEHYLKTEFRKLKIDLDYEYAIYDCSSDKMVYGNYVSSTDNSNPSKCLDCFTKDSNLTYYFAIRFPKINAHYYGNLQQYWIFTIVLFLVLIIYVYSVFLMLQQKRYTDLQKDFINNMTHEFKTPLASILIASNYANKQSEILENPKLSKYMQIIINQSNKLNEHIEKILYVAKTDSKQILLNKSTVKVNDIIALVRENIELKYQKNITLDNAINDNLKINADEFHLYNIIYNLFDNAIKYAESDIKIKLNTTKNPKDIVLSFSDNGKGIPNEDLPFVFDKFYRVKREDSKDIEGFGIGLSYVKRICELHKWKINLKNNDIKGITVNIIIPNADVHEH